MFNLFENRRTLKSVMVESIQAANSSGSYARYNYFEKPDDLTDLNNVYAIKRSGGHVHFCHRIVIENSYLKFGYVAGVANVAATNETVTLYYFI